MCTLVYIYFLKIYYLIFFLAVVGLCCCTQAFSSCSEWGYSLLYCVGFSLQGGFSRCRAQALGIQASVVAADGLSSCGTWA